MIKYLFFDIYQTLVDVAFKENDAWDVFEKFLINRNITYKEAKKIKKLFEKKEEEFYSIHNKIYVHHDWIDNINDILTNYYNINYTIRELKDTIWEYRRKSNSKITLYPNVKSMLNELSKNYILSTASLAHASITIPELKYLGIDKYFDNLYFSSKIGYRKSSPKFYSEILTLSGAKANESIMIGDSFENDVVGGKKAGMYSIWIKNPLTYRPHSESFADEILPIEKISNLPKLISKLNNSQT